MAMAALDEHLNVTINEDINILLLGETGIGKSTFINGLVNHLQFDSFKSAYDNSEKVQCLIPTKFTVIEEDAKEEFNELLIDIGSSDNENSDTTESATLTPTSYVFDLSEYDTKLRVIDTPGIGDTRGIKQDNINQENIVSYLSNLKYLNAVCILLKPNQVRCTVMFQYCVNQLLSLMHKTLIDNIIFVFTHTRLSFFTPGEMQSLNKILKDIEEKENIKIPFSSENVFCIDNESFRYLLACKSNVLSEKEDILSNSWNTTQSAYWSMIDYIMNLSPCNIENTLYLHGTRKKFNDLARNLMDLSDFLKNSINLMKKFETLIDDEESVELINDAKTNIEGIKKSKSIYETDKDNTIMQISKVLSYLRTNAIIVSNDFTGGYINYLIDRENSLGSASGRRLIREYHELTKFYAEVKNIINMDIHHDPFSPVMTREELSSTFPQLDSELKSLISNASKNETEVQLHFIEFEVCEDESTEQEVSAIYKFDAMFNVIKETGTHLLNHLDKHVEYNDLRERYVKEQRTMFNDNNLNSNYPNNAFKNANPKVSLNNETDILSNFLSNDWIPTPQDGAPSASHTHYKKQRYRRGRGGRFHHGNRRNQQQRQHNESHDYPQSSKSCFLDLLDSNRVDSGDFVHNVDEEDDFVFVNSPNKRYFRPRFRGRGRGAGGTRGMKCDQQLHKNFTSANEHKSKCFDSNNTIRNYESHKDNTNKAYNKNKQSKSKSDCNKNNSDQPLKNHLPYKDNASKYDPSKLNKNQRSDLKLDGKNASNQLPKNHQQFAKDNKPQNKNQRSDLKLDGKNTSNQLPKNHQQFPKDNKPQNKNQQNKPKSHASSKNDSNQSGNKQQQGLPNTGSSNRPRRNNNAEQQEMVFTSFKNIFN